MKRCLLPAVLILAAAILLASSISASDLQKAERPALARPTIPSEEISLSETENSNIDPLKAPFVVNAVRFDPYKNFKFRVKWDGRYAAGVSKVSPLIRTTEVIEHREGGDPSSVRKSPGLTMYDPIILERGVTHDPAFEAWVNKAWSFGAGLGAEVSLKDFRKDITIEFYNEAGQLAIAYKVYRCWPSEYQALPELDANNRGVAFQKIVLETEGWCRDEAVTEPSEPSL